VALQMETFTNLEQKFRIVTAMILNFKKLLTLYQTIFFWWQKWAMISSVLAWPQTTVPLECSTLLPVLTKEKMKFKPQALKISYKIKRSNKCKPFSHPWCSCELSDACGLGLARMAVLFALALRQHRFRAPRG
jgi:hypothetical protein